MPRYRADDGSLHVVGVVGVVATLTCGHLALILEDEWVGDKLVCEPCNRPRTIVRVEES